MYTWTCFSTGKGLDLGGGASPYKPLLSSPLPPSPACWVTPTVSNHSAWRDENHPMPELVFLQVNLRFADSIRKPGENTRIIITAAPGSQVALAAVDKSVYLLKGGNQLTTDDVSCLILYWPLEWDQHRTNDWLTDSNKTNYEGMTGQLTIWLKNKRLFSCDNRLIEMHQWYLTVFIATYITARLTDDQKHRDLIDQSGQ